MDIGASELDDASVANHEPHLPGAGDRAKWVAENGNQVGAFPTSIVPISAPRLSRLAGRLVAA
jgi:hypothetical protein